MKTFKKECKHAQFERKSKWLYTQEEKDDNCWNCGGPLTEYKKTPHADTSRVDMEDYVRAEIEADSKKLQHWLDHMNKIQYACVPCWKAYMDEVRNAPKEDYLTVEQMLETMDADKLALIKEVEECGPDCPYYDRLPIWKADYNEDGTPKNGKTAKQMFDEICPGGEMADTPA